MLLTYCQVISPSVAIIESDSICGFGRSQKAWDYIQMYHSKWTCVWFYLKWPCAVKRRGASVLVVTSRTFRLHSFSWPFTNHSGTSKRVVHLKILTGSQVDTAHKTHYRVKDKYFNAVPQATQLFHAFEVVLCIVYTICPPSWLTTLDSSANQTFLVKTKWTAITSTSDMREAPHFACARSDQLTDMVVTSEDTLRELPRHARHIGHS